MDKTELCKAAGQCCRSGLDRRAVLGGMLGISASLAAAPAAEGDPANLRPRPGDVLVRSKGEDKTTPLSVADLKPGAGPIEAWPMDPASGTVRNGSLFNRVLLLRFDPKELSPELQASAADGVVAYTIICTHASCEVTTWVPEESLLECPCHFSRFDPKRNATVMVGPATRRLPKLGLTADNGRLVVAKVFDGKIGGDADDA